MSFRLLPRVLESHAYLGATISFSVDTLRRSTWLFNSCLLYYPWSLVKKVAFITKVISLIILFLMIKRGAFSHPKFGMNLARLSQAMFCTLWLNKRHIHLYKFSWNSTPQSWNDSCDFFLIVFFPIFGSCTSLSLMLCLNPYDWPALHFTLGGSRWMQRYNSKGPRILEIQTALAPLTWFQLLVWQSLPSRALILTIETWQVRQFSLTLQFSSGNY